MIDVKDLHIGNVIYKLSQTFPLRETSLDIFTIKSAYDLVLVEKQNSEYCPIPLTEEWLVKLGFDKGLKTQPDCFRILCDSGGLMDYFILYIMDWGYFYQLTGHRIVTVKSVHQLQNLFYATINQELTVKEDK